jgi:predicted transposase YbfD/YdcC
MTDSTLPPPVSLIDCFQDLEDPRLDRTKRHPLINIVFMALCAVLSDAEGWSDIEDFARVKQDWFAQHLDLPEGPRRVPSDDTFRRVFARLDPEAFEASFRRWVAAVAERLEGCPQGRPEGRPQSEVIALDGKTVRGSADRDAATVDAEGGPVAPLHLVSAWATEQRLILAQQTVESKTNEITVLPDLLAALDLAGCIVTIDAMGTQKTIAAQIAGQQADYVLALKSNHPRLYDDVRTFFEEAVARGVPCTEAHREVSGGHGRIEERRCWATQDIGWLDQRDVWPGLRSIAMVEARRQVKRFDPERGQHVWTESVQRRFYLSSLAAADSASVDSGAADSGGLAERIATAARSHWGIENRVHWVLDVSFGEDASRIRKGHAPQNMAVLRRSALNLVRQDPSRGSMRQKRKRAGWDDRYREEILGFR